MDSIAWKLDRLYPRQANAITTLDSWFAQGVNQGSADLFRDGVRYHKGNLQKFIVEDSRQPPTHPKNEDIHWRKEMAKRLFAIRRASYSCHKSLEEFVRQRYPCSTRLINQLWLARNCRPYCGQWTADNMPGSAKNPTGKACHMRLCPWCWLRKIDFYQKLMTLDPTAVIKDEYGSKRKGIGPVEYVNVVEYERQFDANHKNFVPFLCENQPLNYFEDVADTYFSNSLVHFKPKARIIRFMSPVYSVPEADPMYIGARVSFLHGGYVSKDRINDADDPCTAVWNDATPAHALRRTSAYPLDWLTSDSHLALKLNMLSLFEHRYCFTIKTIKVRNIVSREEFDRLRGIDVKHTEEAARTGT